MFSSPFFVLLDALAMAADDAFINGNVTRRSAANCCLCCVFFNLQKRMVIVPAVCPEFASPRKLKVAWVNACFRMH